MSASIRTIRGLYEMDNSFFDKRIGQLEDDLSRKGVSGKANPILWNVGHLTATRLHVLELLGEKIDVPWAKSFSEPYDASKDYPDIATIRDTWTQVSMRMLARMESVSEDELSKELDYKLPHGNNTVRGAIIFFAYHEGWHLGQIAYTLRCFEMDGLVPY